MSRLPPVIDPPRRRPGPTATVDRLLAAAAGQLDEHGYAGLTVRTVARRAEISAATAYTWFGSKEHLVAETFRRRLAELEPPHVDRRRAAATQVRDALEPIIELFTAEPALAAAATTALLADDPDVVLIRREIGALIGGRLAAALGERADPAVLRALDIAFSGAFLQAGLGNLRYADVGERVAEVAALIAPKGTR